MGRPQVPCCSPPTCFRLPCPNLIIWLSPVLSIATIAASGQEPASQSPLRPGISHITDRIQKSKGHANDLRGESREYVRNAVRIAYEEYGQEKDPARTVAELESVIDSAIEGIRAGRDGRPGEALINA